MKKKVKGCAAVNTAVIPRKKEIGIVPIFQEFDNRFNCQAILENSRVILSSFAMSFSKQPFFAKFYNTDNKQVPYHNTGKIQDNIVYVKTSADYWLYNLDDDRDYYCDF